MRCKHHPNREGKHFCASCGISICDECTEEVKPGEYYCFQCAMLRSVSEVGTSIADKRKKTIEKKIKKRRKWGPFQYFVIVCSALILAMWGFILFGGQEPPATTVEFTKNRRVFLFMVDSAVKRYADNEGNRYPESLSVLVPRYIPMKQEDISKLDMLSYQRDSRVGYRLSLAKAKPGELRIILSRNGIEYKAPPSEGV